MTRAYIGLGILIVFEILILFIGCQSGGLDPTTPSDDLSSDIRLIDSSPDIVKRESASIPALWGLYEIAYNTQTHELTSVPLRGPAFALNVIKFLQPPAGLISGITIGVLDDSAFFSDGLMDVRVILHHPFPGQPVYTGFDVAGILITEGSLGASVNENLTYADPDADPTMRNPDGYTRWMNPTEFLSGDVFGYENGAFGTSESSENSGFLAGATLNPYKYFAHGLGPDEDLHEWLSDPDSIENRGMFPSGATCSRDYELLFPIVDDEIILVFNYAVLAHWASPDIEPVEDPLTDFPPEANCGQPLHLFAVDNSSAYYTSQEAGGNITVDIEIFDWDAPGNPQGVPGEVSKFILWSDSPLLENGWAEILTTEVEWNSGYVASTSVVTIDIPADPDFAGDIPLWIEVFSTNPSSYDQGFDVDVAEDPLASYVRLLINVKDCPKAGGIVLENNSASSGEVLNDVIVIGEDFVEGPDLGVWLEKIESGGEADFLEPIQVYCTDVQFIDEQTITVDLDLSDVPYGDYGLGCKNGCGTVTEAAENETGGIPVNIQIKMDTPAVTNMRTNRTTQIDQPLETLHLTWDLIDEATLYHVYCIPFDIYGYQTGSQSLLGISNTNTISINLGGASVGTSGKMELWITALPDAQATSSPYESECSQHVFAYFQDFETGFGEWTNRTESSAGEWRFVRSVMDCNYSGSWGLKALGEAATNNEWILLSSPQIPELSGTDTVKFEFVHCHNDIKNDDGYQAGWLTALPLNESATVNDYNQFNEVSYGLAYDDFDCVALRNNFGCQINTDNNYRYYDNNCWYVSGFDASAIMGNDVPDHLVIAAATNHHDSMSVYIDDIAILIY